MINKCLNCDIEISLKAKYCSDKCRMQYKRLQPEQQPEQPRTDNTLPINIKTASRKEVFLHLLDCAEGKGSEYQYRLSRTALQYTMSNGVDTAKYLDIADQELANISNRLLNVTQYKEDV